MIRLTINHVNKYGPLQFPAKQTQIFIPSHKVPDSMLHGFYQRLVDNWLTAHPDRQQFGDYVKDIVADDSITDGSKVYGKSEALKKETAPAEEEL